MADNKYCADYAKRGTAGCKKCKVKLEKGSLRLGKMVPNPFSDSGDDMKQFFHVSCLFETFLKAKATTKKIEDPSDVEGWDDLEEDDQNLILKHIQDFWANAKNGPVKTSKTPKKTAKTPESSKINDKKDVKQPSVENKVTSRDNSFKEFRCLCAKIAAESSYNSKSSIVSEFFSNGSSGDGFTGDLYLMVKLLIPNFVKRVYNLQSKQLVNLFSQIFGTKLEEMITDLENGDVADTIFKFCEQSKKVKTATKSNLTIHDVDDYLEELTKVTKEEDQIRVLSEITKHCTPNDLRMIIRLIKRDLRINAGAKHILEGVHPDAYDAFQTSRDLKDVINRILQKNATQNKPGMSKVLSIRASLMTPILPMLAEACKSVEQALKKCPNGMYAEIKYDGERVQVHKQGNQFSYFSRSLKAVQPHKISHFKDFIPQAFPHAEDLILDSEVLLVDNNTGTPLPFGTLGVHKKAAFKDASVCLFVFDCIHYNGENLLNKTLKERRKILEENMIEVPNRVKFSEMKFIDKSSKLSEMIMEVLRKGLEGLVLKDVLSLYEPGKRHWLKVKKDYLAEGVMADMVDLVVVGAYYGTGNKGGMMSIFLMGCYDTETKKWYTVTKVSGGHDDKTLDKLQTQLNMVKISKDVTKVPAWLNVTKSVVPDFVCKNPEKSQVWEIMGAEFSKAEVHTACGISIRFPRVNRIRDDKTWKEATTLQELKVLFENSKEHSNLPDLLTITNETENKASSPRGKKRKAPSSPSPEKKTQASIKNFISPSKRQNVDEKKSSKLIVETETDVDIDAILPNFFTGVKLFMPTSIPDYEMLQRHVISYNGDIVDAYHIKDATHVISQTKEAIPKNISKSAVCVTSKWLSDSIKNQKLLPCGKFKLN